MSSTTFLPVESAKPSRALARAVAASAVANRWVARALSRAITASDPQLESLVEAARATACAGWRGVIALEGRGLFDDRRVFVDTVVRACYLACDLHEARADALPKSAVRDGPHHELPRSWRGLAGQLDRCVYRSGRDAVAPAHAAAAGARDAVVHLIRALDSVSLHGDTETALLRWAQATALACTYAGWSLLLMDTECSSGTQ